MKAFAQLTTRGQARRLRQLAADALHAFGLPDAEFRLIQHWENTTFRVNHPAERNGSPRPSEGDRSTPGRYLLRLHRPHERTVGQIESEIAWLEALHRDTSLSVPIPVHTTAGDAALEVRNADYPYLGGGTEGTRVCSMLRWMPGRLLTGKSRKLIHMRRLGTLTAKLHQHATDWPRARNLDVHTWDGPTLMARRAVLGMEPDVWDELPAGEHDLYADCEARLTRAIRDLGDGPEVHGLIHADLHFSNVLFAGADIRPIDFNDCGHGYFLSDFACTLLGFDPAAGDRPWQDAFFTGYETVRPLPPGTLEYLDLLIAVRRATLMLWCYSCARHREAFRKALPKWRDAFLPDLRARLQM